MTYAAYTKTQNRTTESPRDIEYRLLGAVTAALLEAESNPQVVNRMEAVCWNRDVWGALRMDINHPENALPQAIKDNLLGLAGWVHKETTRILRGETDELDGLISVNKNIMDGLKPKGRTAPNDGVIQGN